MLSLLVQASDSTEVGDEMDQVDSDHEDEDEDEGEVNSADVTDSEDKLDSDYHVSSNESASSCSSQDSSENQLEKKNRHKVEKKNKKKNQKKKKNKARNHKQNKAKESEKIELPDKLSDEQADQYLHQAQEEANKYPESERHICIPDITALTTELLDEQLPEAEPGVVECAMPTEQQVKAEWDNLLGHIEKIDVTRIYIFAAMGKVLRRWHKEVWQNNKKSLQDSYKGNHSQEKCKWSKVLADTIKIKGSDNKITRCVAIYEIMTLYEQPWLPFLVKVVPDLNQTTLFGWLKQLKNAAKRAQTKKTSS